MPVKKIDSEAYDLLKQYSWSGNIRELRNVIERLMILGDDPITKKNIVQFAPK
jgi:DNA-binding NtrC family response regulator